MSDSVMVKYRLPIASQRDGCEAELPCPECKSRAPDALEIWIKPLQETTTGLLPAALTHLFSGGIVEELRRLTQDEPALFVEILEDRALAYTHLTCTHCGYRQSIHDIPIPLDVLTNFTCIDIKKLVPNS